MALALRPSQPADERLKPGSEHRIDRIAASAQGSTLVKTRLPGNRAGIVTGVGTRRQSAPLGCQNRQEDLRQVHVLSLFLALLCGLIGFVPLPLLFLLPGNVAPMYPKLMLPVVISTLMVDGIAHVYGVVLMGCVSALI